MNEYLIMISYPSGKTAETQHRTEKGKQELITSLKARLKAGDVLEFRTEHGVDLVSYLPGLRLAVMTLDAARQLLSKRQEQQAEMERDAQLEKQRKASGIVVPRIIPKA